MKFAIGTVKATKQTKVVKDNKITKGVHAAH